jgi:hypothetical protein
MPQDWPQTCAHLLTAALIFYLLQVLLSSGLLALCAGRYPAQKNCSFGGSA